MATRTRSAFEPRKIHQVHGSDLTEIPWDTLKFTRDSRDRRSTETADAVRNLGFDLRFWTEWVCSKCSWRCRVLVSARVTMSCAYLSQSLFYFNDSSEINLHHPRIGLFFLSVLQLWNCPADIVGQRSAQTSRLCCNVDICYARMHLLRWKHVETLFFALCTGWALRAAQAEDAMLQLSLWGWIDRPHSTYAETENNEKQLKFILLSQ